MIGICLLIDVKDRMSALMNQLCSIDNYNSLVYSGGVKDMYAVHLEKRKFHYIIFFSTKDLKLCFDSEYLRHIFHQFVSSVP